MGPHARPQAHLLHSKPGQAPHRAVFLFRARAEEVRRGVLDACEKVS